MVERSLCNCPLINLQDMAADDEDRTYENLTAGGMPIPMPRNTSPSSTKASPKKGCNGEEKTSPVTPPRTGQGNENVLKPITKRDKKPSPPLKPKPRSNGAEVR